jgi:eukaryotic-like serine/threonine-protein kinase
MVTGTATLERAQNSAMNLPASQLDEADRPRTGAMKFAYASGARPLEGYTIKRGVGRGGFGEVYFATSDAGKEVAIKLIRRNLEVELRGVTQCLNLKHPNLVSLFDIRTDDVGDQWVIMEYVSGESLEDVIDRSPNGMPAEQAVAWMRGMCAGVGYLHDHGIVHRDLKPGNIFIDEGTVKIGDYGLAKFISCSRRSGQTESVGTVHYMAPEIANGRYGREIDTYALGIILFEMLTGHVPFEGESVGEVLMKHLTAEPDLSRVNEPYREIVRRALAKDPDVRIKSVGEMLASLPGGASADGIGAGSGGASNAAFGATAQPAFAGAAGREEQASAGRPRGSEARQALKERVARVRVNLRSEGPSGAVVGYEDVEEPVWKAIRQAFNDVRTWWLGRELDGLHPLAKVVIIIGVVFVCINYFQMAVGLAMPAVICYGIYYLTWAIFIRPGLRRHATELRAAAGDVAAVTPVAQRSEAMTAAWHPPAESAAASPADRYAQAVRRRRQRPNWRDRVNQELQAKPLRDKWSELLSSMLMAAVVASLASLIAPVLMGIQGSSAGLALYLWLALVATLGSWAIMVPSKFVEGKLEDQVPLRVTLLLLGGLVGLAAWGLSDALVVQIPSVKDLQESPGIISHELLHWSHPADGVNPPLAAYVTYFAFLFMLVRWWRQTEFTREARLSLWRVVVAVFCAWLVHLFWSFPQPAGMMVAGVIAFTTQLSSPWLPPSQRRAPIADVGQVA